MTNSPTREKRRCAETKSNGDPCQRNAQKGLRYCWSHRGSAPVEEQSKSAWRWLGWFTTPAGAALGVLATVAALVFAIALAIGSEPTTITKNNEGGAGVVHTGEGDVNIFPRASGEAEPRPRFIVDIRSDFQPRPPSSGKNGIPVGDYTHDLRTGHLRIPCDLINTGEEAEVVRFVEADLFIGKPFVARFEQRGPLSVGDKQVAHLTLDFVYRANDVTSNDATVRGTIITTLGRVPFEKRFTVYSQLKFPVPH